MFGLAIIWQAYAAQAKCEGDLERAPHSETKIFIIDGSDY
jgi:hypothetical protein